MFRSPWQSGNKREDSHIERFTYFNVSVFENVQDFFRQLGVPFTIDPHEREIYFDLSSEEQHYIKNLQKLTCGVIAFDTDGNKMEVNRVDATKFKSLFAESFPKYTPFQSKLPVCRVTEHPAFIKDYLEVHTDILQRWPTGTYAIMNEGKNNYLLVYVDGSSQPNGIRFQENSDGSIQYRNERFKSINDFLHDGQYIITQPHQDSFEKHPLWRTLTDIIDKNQELQYEVAEYVKTRKNPEIVRIVDFLEKLSESTRRAEEHQLISVAISQLYLKPACASDILECLTRALPDAACGVINGPFVTTLGGSSNDAKYYRDILLRGAHDSTQPVDDLMQQLTEFYAERSNAKMRY